MFNPYRAGENDLNPAPAPPPPVIPNRQPYQPDYSAHLGSLILSSRLGTENQQESQTQQHGFYQTPALIGPDAYARYRALAASTGLQQPPQPAAPLTRLGISLPWSGVPENPVDQGVNGLMGPGSAIGSFMGAPNPAATQTGGSMDVLGFPLATTPITLANFAAYGREGVIAALDSFFGSNGGNNYQTPAGAGFGQENLGPTTNRGFLDDLISGITTAFKPVSDALDAFVNWTRTWDAGNRGQQVRSLALTGSALAKASPVDLLVNTVTLNWDKYNRADIEAIAQLKGTTLTDEVAALYDLSPATVNAIFANPAMDDNELAQLVATEPFSHNPAIEMANEFTYQMAPFILGSIATGGGASLPVIGRAFGAARTIETGAGFVRGLTTGERIYRGAEAVSGLQRATQLAGAGTRLAMQANAINTTAGWTVRGFEWGVKQLALIGGNQDLVDAMDKMLWNMPLSMNPGINIVTAFSSHPLQALGIRTRFGVIPAGREARPTGLLHGNIQVGTPGTIGYVGEIGRLNTREGGFGIRIGGEPFVVKGPILGHIQEALDSGDPLTAWMPFFDNLNVPREWLEKAFGPGNADGLTYADLAEELLHVSLTAHRDAMGSLARGLGIGTVAERAIQFAKDNIGDAHALFQQELAGQGKAISDAIKGRYWEYAKLNDTRMAEVKARLAEEWQPGQGFQDFLSSAKANKTLRWAFENQYVTAEAIPTFRKSVNTDFLDMYRKRLESMYPDPNEIVAVKDIDPLKRFGGMVENHPGGRQLVLRKSRNGKRVVPKLTRQELQGVIDTILADVRHQEQNFDLPPTSKAPIFGPHAVDPEQAAAAAAADPAQVARALKVSNRTMETIRVAQETNPSEYANVTVPIDLARAAAKDLGTTADALTADAATSWPRLLEWFDKQVAAAVDTSIARDHLVKAGTIMDERMAVGGDRQLMEAGKIGAQSAVDYLLNPVENAYLAKNTPLAKRLGVAREQLDAALVDVKRLSESKFRDVRVYDTSIPERGTGTVVGGVVVHTPGEAGPVIGPKYVIPPDLPEPWIKDLLGLIERVSTDGRINAGDAEMLARPEVHPFFKLDSLRKAELTADERAILDRIEFALDEGAMSPVDQLRGVVQQTLGLDAEFTPETVAQVALGRDAFLADVDRVAGELDAVGRHFEIIEGRGHTGDMLDVYQRLEDREVATGDVPWREMPMNTVAEATLDVRVEAAKIAKQHEYADRAVAAAEQRVAQAEQRLTTLIDKGTEWDFTNGEVFRTVSGSKAKAAQIARELNAATGQATTIRRAGKKWEIVIGRKVSRPEAIQAAYDAGKVAEGQALNVQEGVARGGTAESGGAMLPETEATLRARADKIKAQTEALEAAGHATDSPEVQALVDEWIATQKAANEAAANSPEGLRKSLAEVEARIAMWTNEFEQAQMKTGQLNKTEAHVAATNVKNLKARAEELRAQIAETEARQPAPEAPGAAIAPDQGTMPIEQLTGQSVSEIRIRNAVVRINSFRASEGKPPITAADLEYEPMIGDFKVKGEPAVTTRPRVSPAEPAAVNPWGDFSGGGAGEPRTGLKDYMDDVGAGGVWKQRDGSLLMVKPNARTGEYEIVKVMEPTEPVQAAVRKEWTWTDEFGASHRAPRKTEAQSRWREARTRYLRMTDSKMGGEIADSPGPFPVEGADPGRGMEIDRNLRESNLRYYDQPAQDLIDRAAYLWTRDFREAVAMLDTVKLKAREAAAPPPAPMQVRDPAALAALEDRLAADPQVEQPVGAYPSDLPGLIEWWRRQPMPEGGDPWGQKRGAAFDVHAWTDRARIDKARSEISGAPPYLPGSKSRPAWNEVLNEFAMVTHPEKQHSGPAIKRAEAALREWGPQLTNEQKSLAADWLMRAKEMQKTARQGTIPSEEWAAIREGKGQWAARDALDNEITAQRDKLSTARARALLEAGYDPQAVVSVTGNTPKYVVRALDEIAAEAPPGEAPPAAPVRGEAMIPKGSSEQFIEQSPGIVERAAEINKARIAQGLDPLPITPDNFYYSFVHDRYMPKEGPGNAPIYGANTEFPIPGDETTRVQARYRLMELSDLVAQGDEGYDAKRLQPRQRDRRVSSDVQIEDIKRNFDPQLALRSGELSSGAHGPQIVDPGGQVVAGNGRTLAMRGLSDAQYAKYTELLAKRADEFGVSRDQIEAMDRPVLVREIPQEQATLKMATALNLETGRMTAAEISRAMAEDITPDDLAKLDLGEKVTLKTALNAAKNQPFVTRMLEKVGAQKADEYRAADGTLNDEGVRVINTAILQKVLRDPTGALIDEMIGNSDFLMLQNGLEDAIGQLAQVEAAVQRGELGQSLSDTLRGAIEEYRSLREQGLNTAMGRPQTLGFGDPLAIDLGWSLYQIKSRSEMTAFFRAYAKAALEQRIDTVTEGMFGAAEPVPDIVRKSIQRAITDLNEARRGKAGFFDKGAEEIAQVADADGTTPAPFETSTGASSMARDVPIAGSLEDAVLARMQTTNRVVIDADTFSTDVSGLMRDFNGEVVYRVPHSNYAVAMQSFFDDPETAISIFRSLKQMSEARGVKPGDPGRVVLNHAWEDAVTRLNEGTANGGDLLILRDLSTSGLRFNAEGTFNGRMSPTRGLGDVPKAPRGKARYLATADDAALLPDDVAILDSAVKDTAPFAAGDPGLAASIDKTPEETAVRNAVDSGAQTFVPRGGAMDEAARKVTGASRGNAQNAVLEVNPPDEAKMLTLAQQEREAAQLELQKAKAVKDAIPPKPDASAATAPPDPIQPAPGLLELAYRYTSVNPEATKMGFGEWTNRPGLPTIGQIVDTIESLDQGAPPLGGTMSPEELATLREGLMEWLNKRLDALPKTKPNRAGRAAQKAQGNRVVQGSVNQHPEDFHDDLVKAWRGLEHIVKDDDGAVTGWEGVQYDIGRLPKYEPGTKTMLPPRVLSTQSLLEMLNQSSPDMASEILMGRKQSHEYRISTARLANWLENVAPWAASPQSRLRAGVNEVLRQAKANPEQDLNASAIAHWADEMVPEEVGLAPDQLQRWEGERAQALGLVGALHKWMMEPSNVLLGYRKFRNQYIIPPRQFDKIITDHLTDHGKTELPEWATRFIEREQAISGSDTPFWESWRRSDNRLRQWFMNQENGVARYVEALYGSRLGQRAARGKRFTTEQYHVFRFLFDARWLALEQIEAATLTFFRDGLGAVLDAQGIEFRGLKPTRTGKPPKPMFMDPSDLAQRRAMWAWWAANDYVGGVGLNLRGRDKYLLEMVKRRQLREYPDVLLEMARENPMLAEHIKTMGDTPQDWLERLSNSWELYSSQSRSINEAEARALYGPRLADGTINQAEFDDILAHARTPDGYQYSALPGIDREIADSLANPLMRPLMARISAMNEIAWNDAAQVIFGQPNRSNIQRLLNHPLLFWPISYQIKATKWLAGLLFDRAFGVNTGSLGALTLDRIHQQHLEHMRDDPQYRQFFADNQTALFIAGMLMPITPFDINVGLSPFTRMALGMGMGMLTGQPSDYQRNIFAFGPGYTMFNLVPRFGYELRKHEDFPLAQQIGNFIGGFAPMTVNVSPSSNSSSTRPAQSTSQQTQVANQLAGNGPLPLVEPGQYQQQPGYPSDQPPP